MTILNLVPRIEIRVIPVRIVHTAEPVVFKC
jgi:hypothetical protein